MIPRRTVLLGGLAAVVAGCKGRSSPTGPTAVPEPGGSVPTRATTLYGYALSDGWATTDPSAFASLLADNGCTLTYIEWVAGAFRPVTVVEPRRVQIQEVYPARARAFVEAMRRRQITTMISVVNWNSHVEQAQDDAWFYTQIEVIRTQIGTDRVILQGVTEPGSRDTEAGGIDKAQRWMQMAVYRWPGLSSVNTGFPWSQPFEARATYLDFHHCAPFDRSSIRRGRTINSTDCSSLGHPSVAVTECLARAAVETGSHLLIFDTAEGRGPARATIEAMGRALANPGAVCRDGLASKRRG